MTVDDAIARAAAAMAHWRTKELRGMRRVVTIGDAAWLTDVTGTPFCRAHKRFAYECAVIAWETGETDGRCAVRVATETCRPVDDRDEFDRVAWYTCPTALVLPNNILPRAPFDQYGAQA